MLGWKRSIQEYIAPCKTADLCDIDIQTNDGALVLTYFKAKHDKRNKELQECYLRMAKKFLDKRSGFGELEQLMNITSRVLHASALKA